MGVQLVKGGELREGCDPASAVSPPSEPAEPEFPIPPEPFAAIALAAALVGLAFVFVRITRTRLLGASIAGAVGAASLLPLATSPTLRALGLSSVTPLYGFWITLATFGLATGGHVLQLRSSSMSSGHLKEPSRENGGQTSGPTTGLGA